MKSNRVFSKEIIGSILLILITAGLITWVGIVFKQQAIRILPLYISLIYGMLQARANRYAPLLGGINSFLYVIAYISLGLYASAEYALLVSGPVQLVTFIRWNKNAYKHSTKFRQLKLKQIGLIVLIFFCSSVVLYLGMTAAGSSYRLLDNTSSLVGMFTMVLMLLSFREYSWLMLINAVLLLVLDLTMIQDQPAQITYLIFHSYYLVCTVRQFFAVRKIYKEQSELITEEYKC